MYEGNRYRDYCEKKPTVFDHCLISFILQCRADDASALRRVLGALIFLYDFECECCVYVYCSLLSFISDNMCFYLFIYLFIYFTVVDGMGWLLMMCGWRLQRVFPEQLSPVMI